MSRLPFFGAIGSLVRPGKYAVGAAWRKTTLGASDSGLYATLAANDFGALHARIRPGGGPNAAPTLEVEWGRWNNNGPTNGPIVIYRGPIPTADITVSTDNIADPAGNGGGEGGAMTKLVFPAWTDYPIVRLGDKEGERAPVRPCEVLDYDGDKYVTIRVLGYTEQIKKGYCYMEPGRCGEVPAINWRVLMSLPLHKPK